MENLDPNQLPMLPDPSEGEVSLPAGPTPNSPIPAVTKTPWYKTKMAKIGLVGATTIAVILIVMFSSQIGQLLNLFGTKAGTSQSVILDQTNFLDVGHVMTPADSFTVTGGKLMLNLPTGGN